MPSLDILGWETKQGAAEVNLEVLQAATMALVHLLLASPGFSPRPLLASCVQVRWRQLNRKPKWNEWQRRQKYGADVVLSGGVPEAHKHYDHDFENLTTLEHQLSSLQHAGFHRPYTPYQPPADLDERFSRVCSHLLPDQLSKQTDMSQIKLDHSGIKSQLLSALAAEFGDHHVPNSLLHIMTSLDAVFRFYNTTVDRKTPYERLEAGVKSGTLPPNLHIQPQPLRFDPDNATCDLDRITAFPRSSTIMVSPEARKRYKDVIAKHSPWS